MDAMRVRVLPPELHLRVKPQVTALSCRLRWVGNVERWRKAARLAGRNPGHPVRTMLSSDRSRVFAFLDRPVEPGEQAEAAQRVADSIFGPNPHLRVVAPCPTISEP